METCFAPFASTSPFVSTIIGTVATYPLLYKGQPYSNDGLELAFPGRLRVCQIIKNGRWIDGHVSLSVSGPGFTAQ